MTTKNPIQTVKLLVMLNSIVAMFAIFLVFFTSIPSESLSQNKAKLSSNVDSSLSVATVPVANPVSTGAGQNNDELKNLPYVSSQGLQQQQAKAQVVSYQRQPKIRASSSR